MPNDEFNYNPMEKMKPWQKVGFILAEGMAAFGEGLTGRPFQSNFVQAQQNDAQRQFEIWKEKQQREQASNTLSAITGSQNNGNNDITLTGYDVDPVTGKLNLKYGASPIQKAREEAEAAKTKEREVAIGKAERLATVGKTIENQWLNTSPYKGAITKTGLVPALGLWDVVKKGLGATDAQRRDQAYAGFISGVRAQLARGMGDVGNLSEYEQRAVIQLVPNLMDSYESGKLKLGQLAQLVSDIKTTRSGGKGDGIQTFQVNGKEYRIPKDKIEEFKKAKGIK